MKNLNKYVLLILIGFLIMTIGCREDEYDMGDLVKPTNLELTYEIFGADDENPYGDGSGLVYMKASASNAITYYLDCDNGLDNVVIPGGDTTIRFTQDSINTYNVVLYAVGTGGITSILTVPITVLSNFDDPDAKLFLTGGASKSWYWAADQIGHLGLGPNNFDYEDGSWTWPQWYQAAPWEKIETSMYDCELVFFLEDDKLKFEQLNLTGEAFIQGMYAEELGLGEEGSYPFDIAGIKNVILSPSSSIATEDGGYWGTTMTFSDGGFMGFYAGSSEFEIMEVTENVLKVRMVQANFPLHAWYHIFTNEKPVNK